MLLVNDDTIAALASPPGGALRGIIRVSGGAVRASLDGFFTPNDEPQWCDATLPMAHAGRLLLPEFRVPVDVSVYFWPTCRSYTGQPMAEIHLVGSPPILEAILLELYRHSVRPAQPGEFTLRAFLAGRIDLVQAEAVLGVIDASHQFGLETALKQLAGGLSGPIHQMQNELVNLLSDLEAGLDFVEEDIEFVSRDEIAERLVVSRRIVEQLLEQTTDRAESVGRRMVVLAGLPNAGKSSLFNWFCDGEAAIVSEVEGTTRDFLRFGTVWDGVSIELVDTAGWESVTSADSLSHDAQQLRDVCWNDADLIVWCCSVDWDSRCSVLDRSIYDSLLAAGRPVLRLLTKCDLGDTNLGDGDLDDDNISLPVSVQGGDGVGLAAVRSAVARFLLEDRGRRLEHVMGTTTARTRNCLEGAVGSLATAFEVAESGWGDELIAAEIRVALEFLGELVGEIYTDDILDRIFSKFCIGK